MGGIKLTDTEWMDWYFGDAYDGNTNFYFAIRVTGYSKLKIYQNWYNDSIRAVDIYDGYDINNATFITTTCQVYQQEYEVDISNYDYILIKRNYVSYGTGTKGKYQLLV